MATPTEIDPVWGSTRRVYEAGVAQALRDQRLPMREDGDGVVTAHAVYEFLVRGPWGYAASGRILRAALDRVGAAGVVALLAFSEEAVDAVAADVVAAELRGVFEARPALSATVERMLEACDV